MNVAHHQLDDLHVRYDYVVEHESSLSEEVSAEAFSNVADFFRILNAWQLDINTEEGLLY